MLIKDLRNRYLWIAKNSLQFLKDRGFQKKGMKYSKQRGNFILRISPLVPRAYLNSEHSYEFEISWEIINLDPEFIQFLIFIWGNKKMMEAPVLGSNILPKSLSHWDLTSQDPLDFDQKYVDGIKEKIETIVLPLFDRLNSLDDVIHLAEEEEKLEQEKREFFPYAIYKDLALFYAYKGWKEKTLEMCDKDIEATPTPAQGLAEKRKKKYIQYFEQVK
jgi:hypothetical protein